MGRKRDVSGLTNKSGYNPVLHHNHCKEWTTKEIDYILNTKDILVVQSLMLGRTVASILSKKRRVKNVNIKS